MKKFDAYIHEDGNVYVKEMINNKSVINKNSVFCKTYLGAILANDFIEAVTFFNIKAGKL